MGDVVDGTTIVSFLKEKGFNAYLPVAEIGEVKEKMVVVKSIGRMAISGISSSSQLYDIMCYVPHNQRSQLEHFVTQVERAIDKELTFKMAISTMNERSIDFYDTDMRAHMISTTYQVYYKNNGRF